MESGVELATAETAEFRLTRGEFGADSDSELNSRFKRSIAESEKMWGSFRVGLALLHSRSRLSR